MQSDRIANKQASGLQIAWERAIIWYVGTCTELLEIRSQAICKPLACLSASLLSYAGEIAAAKGGMETEQRNNRAKL